MGRVAVCRIAIVAGAFAIVAGASASARGIEPGPPSGPHVSAAPARVDAGAAAQSRGRYKKEGDECVWSATDTGPDQCAPVLKGRFKKQGTRCTWAASEAGPDQCRPKTGRFKKDGSTCVWNATDSGPDQCNPKHVK